MVLWSSENWAYIAHIVNDPLKKFHDRNERRGVAFQWNVCLTLPK